MEEERETATETVLYAYSQKSRRVGRWSEKNKKSRMKTKIEVVNDLNMICRRRNRRGKTKRRRRKGREKEKRKEE